MEGFVIEERSGCTMRATWLEGGLGGPGKYRCPELKIHGPGMFSLVMRDEGWKKHPDILRRSLRDPVCSTYNQRHFRGIDVRGSQAGPPPLPRDTQGEPLAVRVLLGRRRPVHACIVYILYHLLIVTIQRHWNCYPHSLVWRF